MHVGILDFNMASNIISNRDNGELTLVISSIKTKVGHLTGHSNKGLVSMTK